MVTFNFFNLWQFNDSYTRDSTVFLRTLIRKQYLNRDFLSEMASNPEVFLKNWGTRTMGKGSVVWSSLTLLCNIGVVNRKQTYFLGESFDVDWSHCVGMRENQWRLDECVGVIKHTLVEVASLVAIVRSHDESTLRKKDFMFGVRERRKLQHLYLLIGRRIEGAVTLGFKLQRLFFLNLVYFLKTFLFWDDYRFACNCKKKKRYKEIHYTLFSVCCIGNIMHNYSILLQPGNQYW